MSKDRYLFNAIVSISLLLIIVHEIPGMPSGIFYLVYFCGTFLISLLLRFLLSKNRKWISPLIFSIFNLIPIIYAKTIADDMASFVSLFAVIFLFYLLFPWAVSLAWFIVELIIHFCQATKIPTNRRWKAPLIVTIIVLGILLMLYYNIPFGFHDTLDRLFGFSLLLIMVFLTVTLPISIIWLIIEFLIIFVRRRKTHKKKPQSKKYLK